MIFDDGAARYPIRMVVALAADDSMKHIQALGELMDIVCRRDLLERLLETNHKKDFIALMTG